MTMPLIAAPPRNLVSLEAVTRSYSGDPVLADVSLGVAAGDRIGVVGKNGGGKSTLLRLIGGTRRAGRRASSRTTPVCASACSARATTSIRHAPSGRR